MKLKLRRRLRCSFCKKPDSEVKRLVGGPSVCICDSCIGICNKILEATPPRFAGWDAMSDGEILGGLKASDFAVEGVRALLQTQVDVLRRRSVSWAAIGTALGMSRQAAWERFS